MENNRTVEELDLDYKTELLRVALDMLDSVETLIENKEVTTKNPLTYEEDVEEQPKVTSQPTFTGSQRQQIKDWLLKQLV